MIAQPVLHMDHDVTLAHPVCVCMLCVCVTVCFCLCASVVQLPSVSVPADPTRHVYHKQARDVLGGTMHLSYDLRAATGVVNVDNDPRVLHIACFDQTSMVQGGLGRVEVTLSERDAMRGWVPGETLLHGGPQWGCHTAPIATARTTTKAHDLPHHAFYLRVRDIEFVDHVVATSDGRSAVVVGLRVAPRPFRECFEEFHLKFWRKAGSEEGAVIHQLAAWRSNSTIPSHPIARRLARWDKSWSRTVTLFRWNTDTGGSANSAMLPISNYRGMYCKDCYAYLGVDFDFEASGNSGWWPKLYTLKVTATIRLDLAVQLAYQSQGSYSYEATKDLWGFHSFGAFPIPTPVASLTLSIAGRARGRATAQARYNAVVKSPAGRATGSVTLGYQYYNGQLRSIYDSSASVAMTQYPSFNIAGSADAEVSLLLDLKLSLSAFLGLASGAVTFTLQPYLSVAGQASTSSACGVDYAVHVQVYRGVRATISVGDLKLLVSLSSEKQFGPYTVVRKSKVWSPGFAGCMYVCAHTQWLPCFFCCWF